MSTETYLDALDVERHDECDEAIEDCACTCDECGDPVLECACETPG